MPPTNPRLLDTLKSLGSADDATDPDAPDFELRAHTEHAATLLGNLLSKEPAGERGRDDAVRIHDPVHGDRVYAARVVEAIAEGQPYDNIENDIILVWGHYDRTASLDDPHLEPVVPLDRTDGSVLAGDVVEGLDSTQPIIQHPKIFTDVIMDAPAIVTEVDKRVRARLARVLDALQKSPFRDGNDTDGIIAFLGLDVTAVDHDGVRRLVMAQQTTEADLIPFRIDVIDQMRETTERALDLAQGEIDVLLGPFREKLAEAQQVPGVTSIAGPSGTKYSTQNFNVTYDNGHTGFRHHSVTQVVPLVCTYEWPLENAPASFQGWPRAGRQREVYDDGMRGVPIGFLADATGIAQSMQTTLGAIESTAAAKNTQADSLGL